MTQTPSTYEQAKAMGMQTAPTPSSDMQTTKDQDSNGQAQTSAFAPASPQQIVTDLNRRIAFTQQHYDGDPVQTYWANRAAIDAQYDNDKRNAAGQGALQNSGGPSQLASDVSPGQPIAYEQTRAPGTQTTQAKPSAVTTAKGQDSGSVRSAWVNALDQFLPKSILPEATLPAQEDIPAWIPQWMLQAADAAKVLNRAIPSNLVTNYLLSTLPTAIKSAYLNSVAAGANALAGKPIEYTPDMTMADYTAQEARKLNVMDPLAEANKISPWLGIPTSILAEGLSDPTTFVGLGELQALGRGGKALKIGDAGYEAELWANKLNGGLRPFDNTALQNEKTRARFEALQKEKAEEAQLADEATQGYTQNGSRVAKETLEDGTTELGKPSADGILRDGSHLVNGKLKPNIVYQSGEYEYIYRTNDDGLIVNARTDSLQFKTHSGRLNHNPDTYEKAVDDHAGHIFGDRFGGSPELDNLVSQARRVNQSEFKVLENNWASALKNNRKVTVNININYMQGSARPHSFDVTYTVDGSSFFSSITN